MKSESMNDNPPGHLVEPSRVEPETDETRADAGARLFVLFFFLIVPALGVVLVAALAWRYLRLLMAG